MGEADYRKTSHMGLLLAGLLLTMAYLSGFWTVLKQYRQIVGLELFYQRKSYFTEHLVMPGETW